MITEEEGREMYRFWVSSLPMEEDKFIERLKEEGIVEKSKLEEAKEYAGKHCKGLVSSTVRDLYEDAIKELQDELAWERR